LIGLNKVKISKFSVSKFVALYRTPGGQLSVKNYLKCWENCQF